MYNCTIPQIPAGRSSSMKFGEMERDALMTHRPVLTQERLCSTFSPECTNSSTELNNSKKLLRLGVGYNHLSHGPLSFLVGQSDNTEYENMNVPSFFESVKKN